MTAPLAGHKGTPSRRGPDGGSGGTEWYRMIPMRARTLYHRISRLASSFVEKMQSRPRRSPRRQKGAPGGCGAAEGERMIGVACCSAPLKSRVLYHRPSHLARGFARILQNAPCRRRAPGQRGGPAGHHKPAGPGKPEAHRENKSIIPQPRAACKGIFVKSM